jgi:multiple sugar transport system ATP-binding protein
VTFDAVTKRYGDVTAVEDLHLRVADGEFMVLLGPSGCGKSTALRMIAGLEEISGGELSIGDRVVNQVIPSKRDVAMVFQSYALYPHMSVRRNIESPLVTKPTWVEGPGGEKTLRKLTSAERGERVAEAARMLDLDRYLDRKPGALSGGQRQRVALARAVVARPAVFLMDEPLSNLDAKLRTQTRAELVDLHRRLGTTFIYVTHDQVEAMTMADRVAIMSEGRLQQVGTPREVYDAPANLFVAGFVGTPALNTATAPVDGGAVVLGSGRIPVSAAGTRSQVTVGLRPEHLRVSPDGQVAALVHQVEWLGHEALLRLQIDGVDTPTGWIARVGNEGIPEVGANVRLAVDEAHVHLFDPDTGERIATGSDTRPGGADLGPAVAGPAAAGLLDKPGPT